MGDGSSVRRVPDEPDAHVMSRHLQVWLRAVLFALIIVTVLGLITSHALTAVAAVALFVVYILLLVVRHYERESRPSVLRRRGASEVTEEEVEIDERVAGFSAGVQVIGVLVVASVVVAAALRGWTMVGVAAAGVFLYMVFLGFPAWLTIISEARELEHEKATGESRESR